MFITGPPLQDPPHLQHWLWGVTVFPSGGRLHHAMLQVGLQPDVLLTVVSTDTIM